MNANRLINMILRQVVRRLVRGGVNRGIDMAAGRGRKEGSGTPPDPDRRIATRETTGRMRQLRRLTRFMR